jgi:transcription elongation GreA/GreB family factor
MPCDYVEKETEEQAQRRISDALRELTEGLRSKRISATEDRTGRVTFGGWSAASRSGMCDACAYRRLVAKGSRELRFALAQSQRQIASR